MTRHNATAAVVTGAASGIGLALAQRLSRRGVHVVLTDIDATGVEDAASRLLADGYSAEARMVDVTQKDQIDDVLESVSRRFSLEYMFNNAGVGGTFPFEQATSEQWDRIISLNLRSVIDGTTSAYKIMREQGRGHIVNTASVAGLIPVPHQVLYNTTKFAIVGLSRTLQLEAAQVGVNVSVVCPGNVATGIFSRPILGPTGAHVPAPADAIPADEAAVEILERVDANEAVIILPKSAEDLVRSSWEDPAAFGVVIDGLLAARD